MYTMFSFLFMRTLHACQWPWNVHVSERHCQQDWQLFIYCRWLLRSACGADCGFVCIIQWPCHRRKQLSDPVVKHWSWHLQYSTGGSPHSVQYHILQITKYFRLQTSLLVAQTVWNVSKVFFFVCFCCHCQFFFFPCKLNKIKQNMFL